MRLVFMGTPDFAVPALVALHEAGHEVLAAVSQPDKPKGRHGALTAPPVKEKAQSLGIPVLQPERASDPAFLEQIRKLDPEVIVVAAYGKILKKELLTLPKYGCVNIHASLLPRWRGAAPIQWAVIAGDPVAGVTAMQMDEGLDTGDMLLRREIPVAPEETGGSLFDKLAQLGGELILETLRQMEAGSLRPEKQPEEGMTYAHMLTKEMGDIDWSRPAVEIERLIRGLCPWPGTYSHLGGKLLKIHRAAVCDPDATAGSGDVSDQAACSGVSGAPEAEAPGSLREDGDRIYVRCGNGWLELLELQLEGKKRMNTPEFLRGAGGMLREYGCLRQAAKEA